MIAYDPDEILVYNAKRHQIAFGESSEYLRNKRRHEKMVERRDQNEDRYHCSHICSNNPGQGILDALAGLSRGDASSLNAAEITADSRNGSDRYFEFPVQAVAIPDMQHGIKYVFPRHSERQSQAASSYENSSSSASASGSNDFVESSYDSARPSQDSNKFESYSESKKNVRVLNGIKQSGQVT